MKSPRPNRRRKTTDGFVVTTALGEDDITTRRVRTIAERNKQ